MRIVQAAIIASTAAFANAALTTITDFGANPSNVRMQANFPANMKAGAPVVLGLHGCGGDGPGFGNGEWTQLSEKYGFIGIFPSATGGSKCWDVSSKESLKHDGGSDSLALANVVRWAIAKKGADPKKIFVTGFSSGGMMTNTMIGAYPDLFNAGASCAGVPYFCFGDSGRAASDISNVGTATCPKGVSKTGKEWGDLVRASYPGFNGTRPRMMIWHGSGDSLVNSKNLQEQEKQWANVHGLSETPALSDTLAGKSAWVHHGFGTKQANGRYLVESVMVTGMGHSPLPAGGAQEVLTYFGIA